MSDSNFTDAIKGFASSAMEQVIAAKTAISGTIAENQAAHAAAPQDEAAIELVEHFYGHEYQ